MRTIYFTLLLCLLISHAFCQESKNNFYEKEIIRTPHYTIDSSQAKWVAMSFASAEVENPSILQQIREENLIITQIDLVYSDFPKNQSFDQLNQKRLAQIQREFPQLFVDSKVKIRWIRQTDCVNQSTAEQLPHGIALCFKEKAKTEKVITQKTPINHKIEAEKIDEPEFFISQDKIGTDTTVLNVFRNNPQLWQDSVVIITDLTYSMEPFMWQVLKWQQEIRSKKKVMAYIFFNDGGGKPDNQKELGKTGGIYPTETQQLDSIARLMELVQAAGDGGDIPENDIEVLLFAIENYPNAKEYILIADTKSSIRDLELISQVTKPVRIILARTTESTSSIHKEYLNLAIATNGSLYTNYRSFPTLSSLQNLQKWFQGVDEYYRKAEGKKRKKP